MDSNLIYINNFKCHANPFIRNQQTLEHQANLHSPLLDLSKCLLYKLINKYSFHHKPSLYFLPSVLFYIVLTIMALKYVQLVMLLLVAATLLVASEANRNFAQGPQNSDSGFNSTSGWPWNSPDTPQNYTSPPGFNFTANWPWKAPNVKQSSRKIVVGDDQKWQFGFNYTNWAIKNGPFYLGDTLGMFTNMYLLLNCMLLTFVVLFVTSVSSFQNISWQKLINGQGRIW